MIPERTKPNSKELHTIELIAGLDARLTMDKEYLIPRLKSVPDLWRQYRIAETAIAKVLDGLYETVDAHALLHMRKIYDHGEVVIRPRNPLNKRTDTQIVLTEDLKNLVNIVIGDQCAMCLKTGRDIKKCKLRKALMNVAPPTEICEGSLCEYTRIKNDAVSV